MSRLKCVLDFYRFQTSFKGKKKKSPKKGKYCISCIKKLDWQSQSREQSFKKGTGNFKEYKESTFKKWRQKTKTDKKERVLVDATGGCLGIAVFH